MELGRRDEERVILHDSAKRGPDSTREEQDRGYRKSGQEESN